MAGVAVKEVIINHLVFILCLASPKLGHAQARFEGEGRVVVVEETKGTVVLDHGPIPGLMPAMRMEFPVLQVELLRGLQVGDVVRFSLEPQGPELVISTIEKARDRPPPRPVIVQAPDFTLPTLSGASVRLSDLRGKVVLLFFWTIRCPDCLAELASLNDLYTDLRSRGLRVLLINVRDDPERVKRTVQDRGYAAPILIDRSGEVSGKRYGVWAPPTAYFVGRRGQLIARVVGPRDWSTPEVQTFVQGLLDAGAEP